MPKPEISIVGYTDLVSRLAKQSSTLYSNNLFRLAGITRPARGDVLKIAWVANEKTVAKKGSRAKLSPTKLYTIEIVPVGK